MSFEIPSRRILNSAGFAVCCGLMGFALFAQHVLLLDPCPLCVLQRVAVISLGVLFLLAALHDPAGSGRIVYAVLLGIAALGGAGIAGWHARLQRLPADEVPACGPGLDYMLDNFPIADALKMVFSGSGECAEIVWQFLGLSMPAWVLIWMFGLGSVAVWNNLRSS
jgi:disulfide bond formation protein DsbB